MDIMVLIKQVPMSSDVGVDEETGVIKRESGDTKMNPYDLYALETAFRTREKMGGTVSVFTMGPPQAEQIIREAYMMGADKGYLLTDHAFAGSDVLATSYALAQGIQSIGNFNLIICGKQTTDGDTAQVASECSEFLNIPCITNVTSIPEINNDSIKVISDMGQTIETVKMLYPCMVAVDKGIYQPRLPSYRRKKLTLNQDITRLNLSNLDDKDSKQYGLDGSPTRVVKIFPPPVQGEKEIWKGKSNQMADRLLNLLKDEKFYQERV